MVPKTEPGIERVRALADISRSALCCHSNETRAPIANSLNIIAQLGDTPESHPGPCSSAGMRRRTDRQGKHTHTDARDQYTFRVVYHDSREM